MQEEPIAALHFYKVGSVLMESGEQRGRVALYADGTCAVLLSPEFRARMIRATARMDHNALLWGASLFAGIAAAGAALVYRGKRNAGYTALGVAGIAALGAGVVRRAAHDLPLRISERYSVRHLSLAFGPSGELILNLSDLPWVRGLMTFGPGEYDEAEAAEFGAALHALRDRDA
ncbi:MAG TPA: hypothetical protein VM490_06675 [Armatimonadaceae bacterium]|nr:hypothetical protein [Armatimonadaceae bacterium]